MNDVRRMIYGTIIGFFLMLGLWFSIIYVSSCGFTFTCNRGQPLPDKTPIPTLIPVSQFSPLMQGGTVEFNKCPTTAMDLLGAWVTAGAPESETFTFSGADGQACEGTFATDIQPLFVENGLWKTGEIGCVSCHNAASDEANGGLAIATYEEISASGILGNGNWEESRLYTALRLGLVAAGHSADVSASNPALYAGAVVPAAEATPKP